MSVFLLPLSQCEELEHMMNSFWWGREPKKKKGIFWTSWDKLCIHKKNGGLSFRKLHNFNLALIDKQAWHLLAYLNSLVVRLYQARYYPGTSYVQAELKANPSFIWRSIMGVQSLIRSGTRRRVGSGKGVHIWGDPWPPGPE